ncbi:MAG: hypothetical protein ACTSYL_05265 [Candidatus Thorarchaeota archaeon]
MIHYNALSTQLEWRRMVRFVVLGMVLSVIVGMAIVTIAPTTVTTGLEISTEESSGPLTDARSSTFSAPPITNVNLLSDTVLNLNYDWSYYIWDPMQVSGQPFKQASPGLLVELNHGMSTLVHRGVNVAHRYYSKITINVAVQVISGRCNITVIESINRYWTTLSYNATRKDLTAGNFTTITLNAALHKDLTQGQDISGLLSTSIQCQSAEAALIHIRSVTITGKSLLPLYPVMIETLGSDNSSIFNSILQQKATRYPAIEIRLNATHRGFIFPRQITSKIHLPVSHYECQLGWHWNDNFASALNFTLDIIKSEGVNLTIVLPTVRIDFVINPAVTTFVSISNFNTQESYLSSRIDPNDPATVYLPTMNAQVRVSLSSVGIQGAYAYHQINIDDSHRYTVHVQIPVILLGTIAVSIGQLFIFAFTLSILVVLGAGIQKAAAPLDIRAFIRDRRGLPMILLLASGLLSWVSYSTLGGSLDYSYYVSHQIFPAFIIQTNSIGGGHTYFSFAPWWTVIFALLYWGSVLLAIDWLSKFRRDPDTSVFTTALSTPCIMVIVLAVFFGTYVIALGEITAILALIVWLLRPRIDRIIAKR